MRLSEVRGHTAGSGKVRRRRWAVLGTLLAVVAAGTTGVQEAGAAARAADQQWVAATGLASVLGPCGGESVALTGPQHPGSTALPVDGTVRTFTIDVSGWDQHTTFRATGRVRASATRSGRGMRRLAIDASLAASTAPTAERRCGAALEAFAGVSVAVTTTQRSWLVAQSAVSGALDGSVRAARKGTSVIDLPLGQRATRLVAPGDYRLTSSGRARVVEEPGGGGAARSGTFTSSVAVIPVGTRRSLSGTGLSFVTFGHRSCADDRVRARLSDAARSRVRKVTFFVNGQRRQVLRGRQLQRSGTQLSSIGPRTSGAVRAELVLRSGARRTTSSTSWPCA